MKFAQFFIDYEIVQFTLMINFEKIFKNNKKRVMEDGSGL